VLVVTTLGEGQRARVLSRQDVRVRDELTTYVESLDDLLDLVQAWWELHWGTELLGSDG
jgi:hypothetical protein